MSDLSVFVFESQQVRFIGTPEKPEWVAADVCAILEIKNPSDALGSFDEDERGLANVYTPGDDNPQGQEMLTVLNKGDRTISILDGQRKQKIHELPH